MKFASQLWRFLRLFGIGVGHASWVAVLSLPAQDKALITTAALAATEAAYRQVFPSGKLSRYADEVIQAWKLLKQVQAPKPPAV